ncbi:hypothetical protein [Flavobacterium sp. UBA4197]|uniref:hypothetical protein n=1 Tax=Flavobacterium sp. UBA4197 TaxID=1946546 RepID=UPI002579DBD8|nr:hypothetical protein [Flavobacterium sp. UBA4197]
MSAKTKMLFILIGDDRTGKTTLQKLIVERLCGLKYKKLDVNLAFNIMHPEIKRKYLKASFGNRSFQEKISTYETIDIFFDKHFNPTDIAFISSHLHPNDIEKMIQRGKENFYNVYGVFFSNSIEVNRSVNAHISGLNWDERIVLDNPITNEAEMIDRQLAINADSLIYFLVNRTSIS